MIRNRVGVLFALGCCLISMTAVAQTPELTVVARSPKELRLVISSLGERGEAFGLSGPFAFLSAYQQHLDDTHAMTAACAFSTKTPMFAAEFSLVDPAPFWAALAEDGFILDAKTRQLTNASGSLTFYVEQNANRLRISDNAEYLKSIRLPTTPTFTGGPKESCVVVHVDWRNMRPETREMIGRQALSVALPQSQFASLGFSIANLPDLLSLAASQRVATWFTRSESLDLRFQIDADNRVQLAVDVVNRSLSGLRTVQSPFANIGTADNFAQAAWNLPIEFELRNFVQAWAQQFNGNIENLFKGDVVESSQGRDVLQQGSRLLAQQAVELLALSNIQGCLVAQEREGRPVIAAGLRLADPVKFDAELQKLLKAAVEDGAAMKVDFNQPTSYEANLHRIELPIAAELKDAREMFGEFVIIHIATTQHALLVGVGGGSDELMTRLITPGATASGDLLSTTIASSALTTRLGLQPTSLSVAPIAQGFRLFATLPEVKPQEGRLTRTSK